jgi:predicted DNA-binding ribbon-helix-helix protein
MSIQICDARTADRSTSKAVPSLKRSVLVSGRKTSISLEDEFWLALRRIATAEGKTIAEVIADVPLDRGVNLSSALRIFILRYHERLAGLI